MAQKSAGLFSFKVVPDLRKPITRQEEYHPARVLK
jgi:hypothetical protein